MGFYYPARRVPDRGGTWVFSTPLDACLKGVEHGFYYSSRRVPKRGASVVVIACCFLFFFFFSFFFCVHDVVVVVVTKVDYVRKCFKLAVETL